MGEYAMTEDEIISRLVEEFRPLLAHNGSRWTEAWNVLEMAETYLSTGEYPVVKTFLTGRNFVK